MIESKPQRTLFSLFPWILLPLLVGGSIIYKGKVLEGILAAALVGLVVFYPRTKLEGWLEDGRFPILLIALTAGLLFAIFQNGFRLELLLAFLALFSYSSRGKA